jgi:SpoVK/Ycf46/Vps4 family AAA+-type ATPase
VVILTTSNVTDKIDLAFVDRADIKQYIGPPSEKGIYNIYLSCLEELMKVRHTTVHKWINCIFVKLCVLMDSMLDTHFF